MNKEFSNLIQKIYKFNNIYYNYINKRKEKIQNIFYKKLIKNSYDLNLLINNINKFFNININFKELKNYITKEDYEYKLTFFINNNIKFIIKYSIKEYDKIKILYNERYNGIFMGKDLIFDYYPNKNTRKISKQLEQILYLSNIKIKYNDLLEKNKNLNKEIKELEDIIKTYS